jgi:hypothetical protein
MGYGIKTILMDWEKVWEGLALSEGMGCTLKTSPDLPDTTIDYRIFIAFLNLGGLR